MAGLKTVIKYELKKFTGSDKGTFAVYAVMSLIWSGALISTEAPEGQLFIIFFSVVIAANFFNTVFISERLSGTLEVLITSGLSRDAVLFGKMIFTVVMTSVIGLTCVALALVWRVLLSISEPPLLPWLYNALFYLSATFLSVAASAYLSVRLSNPRFLHFINLFMISAIVAVYCAAAALFAAHPLILVLAFLLIGIIFTILAKREFAGERIIRPIIF